MPHTKKVSAARLLARMEIRARFMILGTVISSLFLLGLVFITHQIKVRYTSWSQFSWFAVSLLAGTILIKTMVSRWAIRKKLDIKFAIKNVQKERKKRREILEADSIYKRTHYRIDKVQIHASLFLIELFFSDTIKFGRAPIITVNGVEIVVKNLEGNNKAIISIERFIADSPSEFIFAAGENKYMVKNPYLVKNPDPVIFWQCEGATNERAIFIADFLAHPMESLGYPFTLYVGNQKIDVFNGNFIPTSGAVRIPIGKSVTKSDIVGKQCILRYAIGEVHKITLPEPTVLSRNGQPVS